MIAPGVIAVRSRTCVADISSIIFPLDRLPAAEVMGELAERGLRLGHAEHVRGHRPSRPNRASASVRAAHPDDRNGQT
jgi:hypothetical protein